MTWLDGQVRWPSSRELDGQVRWSSSREWPKQTPSRLGHSVTQRHSVHVSHSVVQGLQKHKHQDKEKSVRDQQVAGEVIYKPPFWDSTVGNHFTTYHEHICQHICQHIHLPGEKILHVRRRTFQSSSAGIGVSLRRQVHYLLGVLCGLFDVCLRTFRFMSADSEKSS